MLPRAAHAAPPASVVDPALGAQPIPESGPPAAGPPGGTYVVQGDDTLTGIARRHGVSVDALVAANKLADANSIREGQILVIPAPVAAASVEAAVPIAAKPSPSPSPSPSPLFSPTPLSSTSAPGTEATPTARPSGTPTVTITKKRIAQLLWPIALKAPRISVTQGFQPGHSGIDIGAPTGTPIKAAAGGVVQVAEKSDGAYGWRIVLDHGDEVYTWYAHLSELKVKEGQAVKAGDDIGAVGATGLATGPHLHLELRVKSTPINPRLALP